MTDYLGKDIPKLGFGLMRLPKGSDDKIDIEQTKRMVDSFLAAGGTYFDTARVYDGSEAAIKEALVDRYPRESYQLATKAAVWLGPKNDEEAQQMFYDSLEATGAGYFDFYLLHNLGDKRTRYFDEYGMWDFVKRLKDEGKVKHIGFSLHDNADVLDAILERHPETEFVQLQVNYADWKNGSVQSKRCMDVAKAHGKPVIVMEPVRGGTLAEPPEPVAEILKAANPDASYISWALRFALGMDNVITVLSGMSSEEQMKQNIDIWKNYEPLSDDELDALDKAQQKLEEITEVACTSCHYCMPGCPEDIDIANMMQSLNRASIYGVENGKHWYGFCAGNGRPIASDCIECGQCEDACPQHLPIIAKLDKAALLFDE